jgi:hypothetical protein
MISRVSGSTRTTRSFATNHQAALDHRYLKEQRGGTFTAGVRNRTPAQLTTKIDGLAAQ